MVYGRFVAPIGQVVFAAACVWLVACADWLPVAGMAEKTVDGEK